ncbi:PKD domain-containing protein, partial [Pseudomonadales bacterium]|nr:PKD domain-containing protein [Pseudomonadales bacterium]
MKPKLQTRLNNLFNQIFKPSIKRDHLAASRHLNRTLIDSPQGTKSLLKIIFQGPTAVLCIAFLSACGGGGGGGGPAVPVNRSPVFNLATSLSVAEGTTSITTISVSDPDRDPVTLSFFGPDASQLSLTANQLSFKIPPSFAAPTDADRDGTYEISISAADGLGGATTVATQITVYNRLDGRIVDGPVAGSQVFLDANANRRRDANEPTFTSDASGYFSVTDVGSVCPATGLCDALVVALGGSDTATGQELPGLALFGESLGDEDFIISPVSTLLTLSSTPAAVLTALDLNINPAAITRTDPWETATADNLAGQKLLRINQQLGLFMTSTLALNLNATAAANTIAVANAFDTLIATDALIDLTVSDTLNTLLASALGASDASTNAVAQTMADFNTVINSSTIDPRGAQASAILTTIQANFLEGIKQLSQGTQSAAQFNAQFSAQTLVTAIGADVGLPDQDSDGTPDLVDDDDDGDGVPDSTDAFPLDSTETIDTDADGTGNNADTDDDGDGALDVNDAFPLDATESLDTDNDGQGNNTDEDDDGDGVPDSTDAFPLDSTETIDTDGDGTGNNTDTDDDGDGVDDTRDTNPLDSSLTPPTAVLTLDISEGFSPLLVSVNASSSIAGFGDDTITSYTWNFGDGDSSTEEATSHIYTQVGSFEISLTLTNSDGFSHTATQTVTTSLVTDPLIIEGTIFVSSSVTVDSDVNDSGSTPVSNNTRATAQFVTNPVTIGGFANEAGTGPNFDGLSNLTASGDEFDAYRINALGGEVINLRIATRGDGDLDLLLYDLDGQLIDFSVSATDNESITIPAGAATYDVVVESFAGYSNYVLSVGLDPAIASLSTATGSASVFIGDLIVQPKNDHQAPRMLAQANRVIGEQASARANSRLYQFGNNITEMLAPRIRTRMLPRMATGKPTMTELKLATILAAKQLNRQNDVEYAEPNYRLTAQIEPNDEFYERQWHYQKLNLPAAWNQSTGANNVKIAVLDTGVVANHPDLEARLSADSYDFISNASNAGDGDGVDSDARDPGDGQDNSACSTASSRSSSFHGTHVAGTIGASTNNNI